MQDRRQLHYKINIAGKPFGGSWPSFMPITFELTVLIASATAVFGMLLLNGLPKPLQPGVQRSPGFERASQDRFFLCIEAKDPKFDLDQTSRFLEGLEPHVHHRSPVLKGARMRIGNEPLTTPGPSGPAGRRLVAWLAVALVILGSSGCRRDMYDQPHTRPTSRRPSSRRRILVAADPHPGDRGPGPDHFTRRLALLRRED